jgi:hypothetical protein
MTLDLGYVLHDLGDPSADRVYDRGTARVKRLALMDHAPRLIRALLVV